MYDDETPKPSTTRRIIIFDTTLRDGEQSPGCSMNLQEKLEVAHALAQLGVDVIEAGFPIASPGDFEAVKAIAQEIRGPVICGLARCREADIDRAWEALRWAESPRIHVFLATSAIHREHKLRMTKEQIIELAVAGVRRAAKYCSNVEFSPEDAARTEIDFLCQVVEAAIDAGATTVNIPDTVGYAVPSQMYRLIKTLRERVPNIDKAVISVHCHDDLGMAVANSLAAIQAGAGQVECTINGIGERAGNCALEEIVMALRVRQDVFHADTGVVSQRLVPTSRLVAGITGMVVQRNKAIVGQNAFAHEAGIHQDGILKEPRTYEIMRPEDVGFSRSDLVLGKHSGRAALAARAKALGYELTPEQLDRVFQEFKILADKKKEVYDGDLAALIEQQTRVVPDTWTLESYSLTVGTQRVPEVTMTLRRADNEVRTVTLSAGDGPVDAVFLAIEKLTGISVACRDFHVHSVTVGKDALGEVQVQVEYNGDIYRGRGVSTDSLEASAKAFLNAINRILAKNHHPKATAAEPAG
ncbi:MAG: 2-isopropylmalate synthase [Thermogutta sp.]|nr:MAG: 2-isopropylmalate synthase [Thermogutta sp.]